MPNESANLKLKLYDPDADANALVYDLLKDICGYTNSNFVKIDTSIDTLHNHIIGTDGNVVFYNKQEVFLAVHPVGSIFLSTDGTEPAELYGGTWEQIKDVFLLGASNTHPVKSTGGSATHTQTANEMAKHNVLFPNTNSGSGLTVPASGIRINVRSDVVSNVFTFPTEEEKNANYYRLPEVGNSRPMNILNPYYAVNIWRRIE